MTTGTPNRNPWKGLDSYRESDRLYGRDEEIEVLFSRIVYNIQTVVYSRSGIGKSSLINAGIFPKARRAGMMPVSIRLLHTSDSSHPSDPYIEQVRRAVDAELAAHDGTAEELVPQKEGHEETLWEYLHRYRFYMGPDRQPVTPLLVFDQFEEIFTLEKSHHRVTDFFAQLADLLNSIRPDYLMESDAQVAGEGSAAKGAANIFRSMRGKGKRASAEYLAEDQFHIVLTLREDYLSYLERNASHIPCLKLNRYSLLPINEEQAATIIMEPQPGLVDIDVAKLIIEKVTGETDFKLDGRPAIFVDSAILSLYLSRLYGKMPEGQQKITAELVNKFGDNIIQDFYLDAIEGVDAQVVEYLEDNLLNAEGRRENVSVYNAQHIGGLTDEEIRYLSEDKKIIRRFFYGGDMRIEFIHDILCPVIKDRRDIRVMLKRQQEERRKLLEQERLKRERLEQKALADRRRYRRWLALGSGMLLLILCSWLYHQWMNVWECAKYYESFVQVNGWPVGVGPELSEHEALARAVSYRLSKRGHRSGTPFRDVEVTSPDELLHNNRGTQLVDVSESHDEKARQFKTLLNNTKYYHFSTTQETDTAHVTKFEALDRNGQILYVVTYFNSTEDRDADDAGDMAGAYVWAVYTNAKGTPLQLLDNGADRMQVFLNAEGQEEKYMFFDENGAPRQNDMGYYGVRVHYNEENRTDTTWILDPFSEEEFVETRQWDGNREVYRCFDLKGTPINHQSLSYHRRVIEKDAKGNVVRKEYFAASGAHVDDRVRSSVCIMRYDALNRLIHTDDYDSHGKPYTQNPRFYPRREFQYIGNTLERLYEKDYRWNARKQTMMEVRRYEAHLFGSVVEYTTDDYEKGIYRMKRVENNEDFEPVSVSYYGKDDKPMFDSIENFHKHIIERKRLANGQKIVVHRYYDTDGSLYSQPGRRDYAIDSCVYSLRNLPLCRICYNRDTVIVLSQGYEYKDGIEVARYARGIHGQPIRCPQWERDGLCYYRLQSVKSTADALSFIKPISEYGCTSWAYDGSDPSGIMERRRQQFTTDLMGSHWKKETITTIYADHIPQDAKSVAYVHLLRPNDVADRLGLRDGDLLLQVGSWHYTGPSSAGSASQQWATIGQVPISIKVGRYDIRHRRWQTLAFDVPVFGGRFSAEVYPVYYTDEEYSHFEKLLQP